MSECLQGHTERCKAFNQVMGKFLCENPRDEVKLLSQSLTRYKQAAEEMGKTGEKLHDYLLAHPAIIDIPDDLYIPWMNSLNDYSKLKEELHV